MNFVLSDLSHSYILSDIDILYIELAEKEKKKIIEDALIKVIPNSRDDLGSYRGYLTFGIGEKIAKEVIEYIQEESINLHSVSYTFGNLKRRL